MDKTKAICQIESHALKGEITTQQFKVLIGLIEHNEIQASMKGLYKILRRNKKQEKV